MQNNKQTRSPWCFAWPGRKLNHKTEQSARRWGRGGQEEQKADLGKGSMTHPGVGRVLREDSILTGRYISACLLVPTACHQSMSSTRASLGCWAQMRRKGPFLGGVPCGRSQGRPMGSPSQVPGLQPPHCLQEVLDIPAVHGESLSHRFLVAAGHLHHEEEGSCPEQAEAIRRDALNQLPRALQLILRRLGPGGHGRLTFRITMVRTVAL